MELQKILKSLKKIKTAFGKTFISNEDLQKLKTTFTSLESKAIKQTSINNKLEEKLKETERDYKQVKGRRDELLQENKELEGKINELEDKRIVFSDILKNDYGLKTIDRVEFDARLVLDRVESGSKTT